MKKIAKLLALVLAAIMLAACGAGSCGVTPPEQPEPAGSEASAGNAPESTEQAGGAEIIIGSSADTARGTVDPVLEDGDILRITPLAFEGLVKITDTVGNGTEITPCLAESFEISGDGLTYTFKLKSGVKFWDGSPVTTQDWIWSLERAMSAAESPRNLYAEPIESVEAPDGDTITIKLKAPYAPFLSILALDNFAVQSRNHAEKVGMDKYVLEPMGTGPFYFEDWKPHEYFRMKRNTYYHRDIATNAGALLFNVVKDSNIRIAKLLAGEIDVCADVPANRVAGLQDDSELAVVMRPSGEQRYINFNVTKAPLDNPAVRRALRMATDKDEIIKMVLFGYGEAAHNVFPSNGPYFNDSIEDEGYSVEGAKKLLADAGYKNGFETQISYDPENAITKGVATLLKEQWAKAGVTLTLNPLEQAAYSQQLEQLEHSVTILRWRGDEISDPASFADFIGIYDKSKGFYTGYNNPAIAALTSEAAVSTDTARREAAYREIQKILYDDTPLFPIWRRNYLLATRGNISGFNQTAFGVYMLDDLKKSADR